MSRSPRIVPVTPAAPVALALTGLLLAALPAVAADDEAPKPEVLTSGEWSMVLPLGLQADSAYVPEDNPITDAKVELGKMLYFDKRLSSDGTISCASCHIPFHGFTDPHPFSAGVDGALGGRNSPTVLNRLFSAEQFWDGRAEDLEDQAAGPMTNPVEMAMASHDVVVSRLRKIKGYMPLFKAAFGKYAITIDEVTQAIATYERTILTGNSPYDRYQAGDGDALSPSAVRGMKLFSGKANCNVCHAGFNFTDETYQNIGVGMDAAEPDLGRHDVTKDDADKGKFKTPTLRDVALTAPYMHDGSEATLMQVVEFYDRGGIKNPNLSAEIKPLKLTAQEKVDLVAFMQALTGETTDLSAPAALPQ